MDIAPSITRIAPVGSNCGPDRHMLDACFEHFARCVRALQVHG